MVTTTFFSQTSIAQRALETLRTRVRQLLYRYRPHKFGDEGFKLRAARILDDFHRGGRVYQDFGEVVEERQRDRPTGETDHIWDLLDEVEPRIRTSLEHWHERMQV